MVLSNFWTHCLRLFSRILDACTRKTEQFSPSDLLARYILSSRFYSSSKRIVRHQAFLPMRNPETSLLETSVFRISHLKDHEIWEIGQREVIRNGGRRLHG